MQFELFLGLLKMLKLQVFNAQDPCSLAALALTQTCQLFIKMFQMKSDNLLLVQVVRLIQPLIGTDQLNLRCLVAALQGPNS